VSHRIFAEQVADIDRAQHGVEPLLHGIDVHDQNDWPLGRAVRFEQLACLGDSVLESA
jgi:hypothetical protein